jgi:hypothetical protein
VQPSIDDFIPSDVPHWQTREYEDDAHVVPDFGPYHYLTLACWCHPVWNTERYTQPVILHNVAQ